MFFVSLANPVKYDVERFGYEEDAEGIEDGHVFGLIAGEETGNRYIKEGVLKSHYRVKKNLGSKLEKVELKEVVSSGNVKLVYKDGDVCGSTRYKTVINLICDMTEKTSGKLEHVPFDDDSI